MYISFYKQKFCNAIRSCSICIVCYVMDENYMLKHKFED